MGRSGIVNLPSREAIFDFIVKYKRKHDGVSPNIREIQEGCGISSTSVVNYHLSVLEQMNRIRVVAGKNRGIEVIGGEWVFHSEYVAPHPIEDE